MKRKVQNTLAVAVQTLGQKVDECLKKPPATGSCMSALKYMKYRKWYKVAVVQTLKEKVDECLKKPPTTGRPPSQHSNTGLNPERRTQG